jgi:two-component system, chemotaxis family, chemotaxis protein CheY
MKTCLIVDDSRVVRKLARLMLEDLEFECTEVDDGPQALEAVKASMPDLVFLDWNMPQMSGIDVMRQLRALPGGNRPKIVFCSVYNEMNYIKEALDAGADEYIMKPFDNDIVISKLQIAGVL